MIKSVFCARSPLVESIGGGGLNLHSIAGERPLSDLQQVRLQSLHTPSGKVGDALGLVALPHRPLELSAEPHLLTPSTIQVRLEQLHLPREGRAASRQGIDPPRQFRNLGLSLAQDQEQHRSDPEGLFTPLLTRFVCLARPNEVPIDLNRSVLLLHQFAGRDNRVPVRAHHSGGVVRLVPKISRGTNPSPRPLARLVGKADVGDGLHHIPAQVLA
ncbi:hypothetical protein [Streptomyces sp. NPDC001927]